MGLVFTAVKLIESADFVAAQTQWLVSSVSPMEPVEWKRAEFPGH